MIRIGDFSKLSRVSIKTLRYYDDVGLLKPTHVDGMTGYRSYAIEQLARLNRILALKDLGFSLAEISELLDENISSEQLRGMLRIRQSEAQKRVRDEQERLERIETRLRQIELEDKMSQYDVVIKQVDPISVACLRGLIPAYSAQGTLWETLESYLAEQDVKPIGPCFTLYFDEGHEDADIDAMVCEPIDVDLADFNDDGDLDVAVTIGDDDEVAVVPNLTDPLLLFADSFETGDISAWSSTVP